jgi:hypothetical protein
MQRMTDGSAIAMNALSKIFEIEGGGRHIQHLEMTYTGQRSQSGQSAVVNVWGAPSGDKADPRSNLGQVATQSDARIEPVTAPADDVFDVGWELLGREQVGPSISRNVIPIGRHEGRFDALRLRVLTSDVAFHDIRVVYLNGDSDTLAVRRLVRAGDASPPLSLRGDAQFIREVELIQEANPEMAGRAVVQVWAHRPDR